MLSAWNNGELALLSHQPRSFEFKGGDPDRCNGRNDPAAAATTLQRPQRPCSGRKRPQQSSDRNDRSSDRNDRSSDRNDRSSDRCSSQPTA